ncbi:MAG: bacterioferritin-associated ferredoxin [Acidimicrobiia bacterium]|jgi:bacterioferritin-associated ferredoxin
MIVCSCRRINDRTVDAAAAGASSLEEVIARCGAGSRCGGCHPELQRILESHVAIRSIARHSAA